MPNKACIIGDVAMTDEEDEEEVLEASTSSEASFSVSSAAFLAVGDAVIAGDATLTKIQIESIHRWDQLLLLAYVGLSKSIIHRFDCLGSFDSECTF